MNTSARNQFPGTVTDVRHGAVNDEIVVEVIGGQHLVAIVTHESSTTLGLQPGTPAFALIKASSVIIATDLQGTRFSTRNQMSGTITRLRSGAVNTEVVIGLPGGAAIAAIITNESSAMLELAVGKPATALFKAANVILGVPACTG